MATQNIIRGGRYLGAIGQERTKVNFGSELLGRNWPETNMSALKSGKAPLLSGPLIEVTKLPQALRFQCILR